MVQGKKSNNVFVRDVYQKAIDAYNLKRKDTGLVFERSMAEHECLWDTNYPECSARLTRVLQRCEELGLISRCKFVAPKLATESEILAKHSQKQIDILKATDRCTDVDNLELLSSKYDAIYVHPVREYLQEHGRFRIAKFRCSIIFKIVPVYLQAVPVSCRLNDKFSGKRL